MSKLVYLMCSLPSLSFGQQPPISQDEFLTESRNQLSSGHFKILEKADLREMPDKKGKGKLKKILAMQEELKGELSQLRKTKGESSSVYTGKIPGNPNKANPLEREKLIMQWQWDQLESMEEGKTFTMSQVIIYKLKLQILFRLSSFNSEKGGQVLESVVNPSNIKEEE